MKKIFTIVLIGFSSVVLAQGEWRISGGVCNGFYNR